MAIAILTPNLDVLRRLSRKAVEMDLKRIGKIATVVMGESHHGILGPEMYRRFTNR